jgi:hypothetical protein
VPLAPSLGASASRWVNLGETSNKGIEALITAALVETDVWTWDVTLAGSINENELVSLGGEPPIGSIERFVEGKPLGGYWAEPILDYGDADGNGIIGRDEISVGDTLEYIGPSFPQQEATLGTTVSFMDRFQVRALFEHRGDYYAYNNTERFRCRFLLCGALIDRDTPLWDQARAVASLYDPSQTVDGYIEKADFIKFRELSFTFFVPSNWAQTFRASNASVTVTGRNLATWTDYTGMDPEINSAGSSDNFGTSEFLTQPPVRLWTVRFSFGF